MQLIETRIASMSGSAVTVEFIGEGNEMISVTMSNPDGSLKEENAIAHAKAVMIQLATFDADIPARGSVNRYDALSNGNFDAGDGSRTSGPVPTTATDGS
ncbi:hypothetical protein G6K98_32170 [Agrobacterium rhizogenes]|nr:hypothetical protein [Rhizobium rhizogenes]NTH62173.1 hypothetical protein [Rhizobium rhizogenes]NTH93799.1 hypothetical protein [Rhizobium rhizogenes]